MEVKYQICDVFSIRDPELIFFHFCSVLFFLKMQFIGICKTNHARNDTGCKLK